MGIIKRTIEEPNVCGECGAEMTENEDGELECDSPNPCMAQMIDDEKRNN
jgi:hypothetical protein